MGVGPRVRAARRVVPVCAVLVFTCSAPVRADGDPRFEEHPITSVPRGLDVERGVAFAPDGSQVAYVGVKEGKSVPVIGAAAFEPYWFVGPPQFSADGSRVAFGAQQGGDFAWKVLVIGK